MLFERCTAIVDKIFECAQNYENLIGTEYDFVLSVHKKARTITLSFELEDFRHMSGLQYVDDIEIEQKPSKIIKAIKNKQITDEILEGSDKYKDNNREGKSVKSRIEEMINLEKYLDIGDVKKDSSIRIFEMQQFGSRIEAEYFIEATLKSLKTTAYIFIRKRKESDKYVIVSMFKKGDPYTGTYIYWLLKRKNKDGKSVELYRHPNYKVGIEDDKTGETKGET